LISALVLGIAGTSAPARPVKAKYVRMDVDRVGVVNNRYVVVLKDAKGNTLLPIIIGSREAQAIQMGISNMNPPRPLTHNLLLTVVKRLGGKILRLEIISLRSGVFIGRLTLRDARARRLLIDARPSDLITLAVHVKQPIWVAPLVVTQAGIKRPPASRPPARPRPTSI
jgi:bifunctional DNase/RNase